MFSNRRLAAVAAAALTAGALTFGTMTPANASTPSSSDLRAKYGTGTQISAPAKLIAPNTSGLPKRMRAMANVATSYDLRQWSVPVGDQKDVNACVPWATGYSMAGWYSTYFGQQKLFAPMYIYSQTHLPSDGGSYTADAYNVLQQQGIVTQSQYPQGNFDLNTKPTPNQVAAAAANKMTATHWLYTDANPGDAARTSIQAAISANHPVVLGFKLVDAIYNLSPGNAVLRGASIPASAATYGGHDVLVVGYNTTGAIVQNQWGGSWGEKGYATLDWDFIARFSYEASWVWGFQANLPAQAPGAPDRVQVQSYNGTDGRSVIAYWNGTGTYDDSVRNPVTGFVATLRGSDGSSRSTEVKTPTGVNSATWSGLNPSVTYTVSLYAKNAVGLSIPTEASFLGSANQIQNFTADAVPSPAMPAGAGAPAQPSAPSTSTPTSPSKPAASKPSNPRYNSLVVDRVKTTKKANAVRLNWMQPSNLGKSTLASYTIKVVGSVGAKVKYSRSFTLSKSSTGKKFTFSGTAALKRNLQYKFTIYAKNAAGLTSSGYSWKVTKL